MTKQQKELVRKEEEILAIKDKEYAGTSSITVIMFFTLLMYILF